MKEPRLAIESDIHLSIFPSVSSCLSDFQFLPNDVYNGFEAIAENIDKWRGNLIGRIKQYASTISDLQSTVNSAIYSRDLNAHSFSLVSARLDHFADSSINRTSVSLISVLKSDLFFLHLINLK